MSLPVLYSAHHAAWSFADYAERIALTPFEQLRYCDIGTELVAPINGVATFYSEVSRGLADLNRAPNHPGLHPSTDFSRPTPNGIWIPRHELTPEEKSELKRRYYDTYHEQLLQVINDSRESIIVVCIDNTAPYTLGVDAAGQSVVMPHFVLSNNGNEGAADGAETTCSPALLKALGAALEKNFTSAFKEPPTVAMNLVYKGGYITQKYTNYSKVESVLINPDVQSLQLEYNYAITHDFNTMEAIPGRTALLQEIISQSMKDVFTLIGGNAIL